MVVGNVALSLFGLSLLVAFVTFLGAHNTILRIPNFAKPGCLTSIVLLLAAGGAAVYAPAMKMNDCVATCDSAMAAMSEDHGDFQVHVDPAKHAYKSCVQGAKDAVRNAAELGVEANEEPAEVTEARCLDFGTELCTRSCYDDQGS
jgi:hypothetical protein